MTERTFTPYQVRRHLKRKAKACGGLEAFANENGLPEAYVIEVFNGLTSPSGKLLKVLGYRKVTRYARSRSQSRSHA